MGASSSACKPTKDDILQFFNDTRRAIVSGQDSQARELMHLSYEEFAEYILALNEKCRSLVDSHGKYLMFAVKKGTADSTLWKATVRVYCLKLLATTNRVESGRCISLQQFMHLRRSMVDLLDDRTRMLERGALQLQSVPEELRASVVLNKCEELASQSSQSGDLGSDCTVCMERRTDVVLPCAHAYCRICIEKWQVSNSYCPVCRDDFDSTDDAWVVESTPSDEEITKYLLSVTDAPV